MYYNQIVEWQRQKKNSENKREVTCHVQLILSKMNIWLLIRNHGSQIAVKWLIQNTTRKKKNS